MRGQEKYSFSTFQSFRKCRSVVLLFETHYLLPISICLHPITAFDAFLKSGKGVFLLNFHNYFYTPNPPKLLKE